MAALSLEQAPPLSAPLRFFLTGPLFGAAAGALLAVRADDVVASRWTPAALGVVHLLVLGFMLQVMAGALLQLLPVAAGASVWRPRWVAGGTHVGLLVGTVLLVAGFLGAGLDALRGAAVTLAITVAGFALAIGVGLVRSRAIGPTLLGLRLSVVGLIIAASLGVTLAGALGWGWPVPILELTAVHAAWGLLGWAVVLVAAVANLVVPMFQLTPAYPVALSRAVPLALNGALVLWALAVFAGSAALGWVAASLATAALLAFAVATLRLQAQRKRRMLDTTFWSWRLGIGCLLLAALLGPWLLDGAPAAQHPRLEYLLGVLLLAGAFPAVIGGMLYKIVPFLCWLHLQRVMKSPPHMQQLLPEQWARWQFRLHAVALSMLIAGAVWPPAIAAGGLLLSVSFLALELNLLFALRRYLRRAP